MLTAGWTLIRSRRVATTVPLHCALIYLTYLLNEQTFIQNLWILLNSWNVGSITYIAPNDTPQTYRRALKRTVRYVELCVWLVLLGPQSVTCGPSRVL